MAISPYMKNLRDHVGTDLLLMPGVAGIVRNEAGEILFQRRTDDGQWGLPAGAVDPGESPAAAIVREMREETGLQVEAVGIIGVFGGAAFRHHYPNGDTVEYLSIIFECRVVGGALGGEDDETLELKYFSLAERPALPLPFPAEIFTAAASNVLFNR
jgi:mutator protein MutT